MFSIYIGNLVTPRSTEPTSSFKVRIYDQNGNLQFKKESLAYSQVAQAKPFTNVALVRFSLANGANNVTYTFSLMPSQPIYKNEYLKLTPPIDVVFGSGKGQCLGQTPNLQTYLSCSLNNQSLYISLAPSDPSAQSIPGGTPFSISVSMIQNPASFKPTGSFKVYVSTSRLYDYYVNQIEQGVSVVNTAPGSMTANRVQVDSKAIGAVTNYSVYWTTSTFIDTGGYFEILFPQKYYAALTSVKCSNLNGLSNSVQCSIKSGNQWVVQVTKGISVPMGKQTSVGIKIFSIKNPSSSVVIGGKDDFQVTSFTSDGYMIDQTEIMGLTIGCQYPCATCSNDSAQCTSCSNTNGLNFLYLYGTTCGTTCPSGFYDDPTNICQKCSYPCQNCFLNSKQCTQCLGSSQTPYLNTKDSQCYSQCPSGSFASDQTMQCESCSSNCKECAHTSETCTVCNQTQFLFSSKCFAQCPNTTVPYNNTSIKQCQDCKAPCKTCSGLRDNCTSCQLIPRVYYLHEGQCVETCPKTYLPNKLNSCEKKSEPTYQFLSFIISGTLLILCIVSNKVYPLTRFFTAYLSFQSLVMPCLWVYLLVFLLHDKHYSSSAIVCFGLLSNLILNILWYSFYCTNLRKQDAGYRNYSRQNPCTQNIVVLISGLISFQGFRIQYSRMFGQSQFSCTFTNKDRYYIKLNRFSVMQMAFVYLPIIGANIYNLQWTWDGRQVYWVDIESLVTSALVLVAHVVVILRSENKITVEERSKGETAGEEDTEDKIKRRVAFEKIVRQVKGNKEAQMILGLPDGDEGADVLAYDANETGEQEDKKKYLTIGGRIGDFKKIKEDTGRTIANVETDDEGGPNIKKEHGYTSMPADTYRVLQKNSPAQRKLKEFQKELEVLRSRKRSSSKTKSSKKSKKISPQKNSSQTPQQTLKTQAQKSLSNHSPHLNNNPSLHLPPLLRDSLDTNKHQLDTLGPSTTDPLGPLADSLTKQITRLVVDVQSTGEVSDVAQLQGSIASESRRKEELQVIVDDLQEQVAALMEAFKDASRRRSEELLILREGQSEEFISASDDQQQQQYQQQEDGIVLQDDERMDDRMDTTEGIETEYEPIEGGPIVIVQRGAGFNIEGDDPREETKELNGEKKSKKSKKSRESQSMKRNEKQKGSKGRSKSNSPNKDEILSVSIKQKAKSPQQLESSRNISPQPADLIDIKVIKSRQLSTGGIISKKKRVRTQSPAKGKPQTDQKKKRQKSSRSKSSKRGRSKSAIKSSNKAITEEDSSPDRSSKSPTSKGKSLKKKPKSKSPAKQKSSPSKSPSKKKKKSKSPRKGKSKGRKSKSKRRRSKSKRSKSKRSKSKKSKSKSPSRGRKKGKAASSKSPKRKKPAKVAPMPNNKEGLNNFDQNLNSVENSKEDNDVDRLSEGMTQEEFLHLLDEERGAFILEHLTDDMALDDHQQRLEAKILLRRLANLDNNSKPGQKKKLKEYINELSIRQREYFQQMQDENNLLHDEQQPDLHAVQDNLLPKSKIIKRKRRQQQSQMSNNKGGFDAYFNHLPFEKAVIESNGRTPYTNREVEQIVSLSNASALKTAIPPKAIMKGSTVINAQAGKQIIPFGQNQDIESSPRKQ